MWRIRLGVLFRGGFEDELGKLVERLLPVPEVVIVLIHVPRVRHFLFLQVSVDALTDADEAVFVAAGNPEPASKARVIRQNLVFITYLV